MVRGLVVLTLALSMLPAVARAQAPAGLVGTWERVSIKDAEGKDTQPPAPAAFLIIGADGFYSQIGIPTGRPKVDKPIDQMTKEELVARFNRTEARRGRYTVKGNQLTRRYDAGLNPNQEGTEATQLFRIEAGVLILSSTDPKLKNEARFKRVK